MKLHMTSKLNLGNYCSEKYQNSKVISSEFLSFPQFVIDNRVDSTFNEVQKSQKRRIWFIFAWITFIQTN